MADKCFNIAAMLEKQKLKLNQPSFLRAKDQFSASEVLETRRIASLRTYVGRAIERFNKYRRRRGAPQASQCKQRNAGADRSLIAESGSRREPDGSYRH